MEPQGKVIMVTGASAGIGLASARALLRAGARVVFAARTLPTLEAEVARAQADGGDAFAVAMDVTDSPSVNAAIAKVLGRYGRIDAVIGFAGNGGTLGFWDAKSEHDTRAMFDVHLFGMERVARAVLPAMLAQRAGTIVNIASAVGWVPMPSAAAYSAAKAAVISFTAALRGELAARGVDVMLFAPPHTHTPAGDAWQLGVPMFTPEWVADELVRTLRRGRPSWLAGLSNRMLLVLQRLSPRLAVRIMRDIGLRAGAKAQLAQDSTMPAA